MSEGVIKMYSLREVERHNSEGSLWVIIADKVYDLTKFLREHPGGHAILLQHGGTDATNSFEDQGHSLDAREMMEAYEIGELCIADRKESTSEVHLAEPIERGFNWGTGLTAASMVAAAFIAYQLYNYVSK